MATDSTLSVGVDSSGVRSASDDLKKFVQRGNEAEKTTKQIEAAFKKQTQSAEQLGRSIGQAIVAIGAAAVGGVVALDRIIKSIGQYQDLSDKTGADPVGLASLQTSADVAGVSIESVADSMVRLSTSLSKVDDESKGAGKALKAIGIDIKTFKDLDPAAQYRAIAEALAGYKDGAEKTAVAVALFGKGGAEQLKVLKEVGQETAKYNLLTREQIALADEYGDSAARLQSQLSQIAQAAAIEAAPAILALKKALFETIAETIGLDKVTGQLASNGSVRNFAEVAVQVLGQVINVAQFVSRVFEGIGQSIYGVGAAIANLATGDFKIAKQYLDDIDKKNKEIQDREFFSTKLNRALSENNAPQGSNGPTKKIDPNALLSGGKKGRNTADSEAKAQLRADLEDIRIGLDAQINAYKNAGSILEAIRSAELIDEGDYYDAKRALLQADAQAQVRALASENDRLAAQKGSKKDLIDNQREIAKNEARIAIVQADTSAKIIVLDRQQEASKNALTRAYIEAEAAADAYIRTIQAQASRTIGGVGLGDAERQRRDGLSAIEDRFLQKRDQLESDRRQGAFKDNEAGYQQQLQLLERTKARELAIYEETYRLILESQANFNVGASEAINNYLDDAKNVAQQTEDAFTRAFQQMEGAFVEFVKTGKLSFSGLVDSIIEDIARYTAKQLIANSIMFAKGGGLGDTVASIVGAISGGRASGGPVSAGRMYQVNEQGPELLNVAGKQYLMMGSQGGSVTPNGGESQAKQININVNVQGQPGQSRDTLQQQGVAIGSGINRSLARST